MNRNQMLNILAAKEQEISKNSEFSGSNGSSTKRNYLPFFKPNALFMNRDEVRVMVLPNPKEGMWFKEYKKHMISLGQGNFKQFICLESKDFNDRCPLCEFLKDNATDLGDKKLTWQLSAKDIDMMFIYNPYAKQIQRYETQAQGFVDILKPITENAEATEIFTETGFDLIFKMDGKYPRVVGIATPSMSVVDALNEATNKEDVIDEDFEIKSFISEIMPYSKTTTKRFINTTVQQIIKGVAGQFDVTPYLFSDEETTYVPQNKQQDNTTNDGYDNYTPTDDDNKPTFDLEDINSNTSTDSEEVQVNDFLNNYKRNNRR